MRTSTMLSTTARPRSVSGHDGESRVAVVVGPGHQAVVLEGLDLADGRAGVHVAATGQLAGVQRPGVVEGAQQGVAGAGHDRADGGGLAGVHLAVHREAEEALGGGFDRGGGLDRVGRCDRVRLSSPCHGDDRRKDD